MKKYILFLFVALFFSKALASNNGIHDAFYSKNDVDFLMLDENGFPQLVNLKSFQGRNVILSFWASWCQPCIAEMPTLDNFANKYTQGLNATIIPVSIDDYGFTAINGFYSGNSINYLGKFLDQNQNLMDAFRVETIPTTIILDENGNELERIVGFIDWDKNKVVKYVSNVINNRAN